MSACGLSLQPRGGDSHPAGSLLLCVRPEPGESVSERPVAWPQLGRVGSGHLHLGFLANLHIKDLDGRSSSVCPCGIKWTELKIKLDGFSYLSRGHGQGQCQSHTRGL